MCVEQNLGCTMLEVTMSDSCDILRWTVMDSDMCLWVFKDVVLCVHISIILWAHPWLTFLFKASAAEVPLPQFRFQQCELYVPFHI